MLLSAYEKCRKQKKRVLQCCEQSLRRVAKNICPPPPPSPGAIVNQEKPVTLSFFPTPTRSMKTIRTGQANKAIKRPHPMSVDMLARCCVLLVETTPPRIRSEINASLVPKGQSSNITLVKQLRSLDIKNCLCLYTKSSQQADNAQVQASCS